MIPSCGDIILVNLDPTIGHEQGGYRPCLVISNTIYNKVSKMGIVMPITTKEKGYPFEVKIPTGLQTKDVILSDAVKSIDLKARNVKVVGKIPEDIVNTCINNFSKLLQN